VSLSEVCGKCQVIYVEESLDSRSKLDEYFSGGPDRFYFTEARILFKFGGGRHCHCLLLSLIIIVNT